MNNVVRFYTGRCLVLLILEKLRPGADAAAEGRALLAVDVLLALVLAVAPVCLRLLGEAGVRSGMVRSGVVRASRCGRGDLPASRTLLCLRWYGCHEGGRRPEYGERRDQPPSQHNARIVLK